MRNFVVYKNAVVYKRSAIMNNDCTPWCLDLFGDLVVPYLNNKYNNKITQMIITEYNNFCSELFNMKKVEDRSNGFELRSENVDYSTIIDNSKISESFITKGCPMVIKITYDLFDAVKEKNGIEEKEDDIVIRLYDFIIRL